MKIVFLTILCFGLAGCPLDVLVKAPPPYNADCDARCFAPCDDPMIPLTEDPDSAILSKKYEHVQRKVCEARRDLCVQCLNRAKKHEAITW